ncbi:hypothetical protein KTN05_07790 [Paracoccus sp. Z118]|nr:hypothetical protein [Paracoccus sp. Z118]MBV0891750.1 hypothetical protein [Paracoccus sp. Z118]
MTIALAILYGRRKETGWTSPPAKALLALISAWFASTGIIADIILILA